VLLLGSSTKRDRDIAVDRYRQRRDRVLGELVDANRVPFLTRDPSSIRYLTGLVSSHALLVLAVDRITLITDGRYQEQAYATGLEVIIGRDLIAAAQPVVAHRNVVVDGGMAAVEVERLRQGNFEVSIDDATLSECRQVKDSDELDSVAKACDITVRALFDLITEIKVGDTEIHIARRLEQIFGEFGAHDRAFPTIVAAGAHSAQPHHRPTHTPVAAGDLLVIDCGAMVDGYHADMTRTFVVGAEPTEWQRSIHEVVLAAQEAGRCAAIPGVRACEIDAEVRSIIETAGLGPEFTHGTGHGVGLEIHEAPMVSASSGYTISAGTPITIEPGVYRPGRGGIRIEDIIVVDNPTRVLTEAPRHLITIGQ
jgi:Xaa-Pro aminopeptidase